MVKIGKKYMGGNKMELERQPPTPTTWGNDPFWNEPRIENHFREIIVVKRLNN